jgi:hypothetical protein
MYLKVGEKYWYVMYYITIQGDGWREVLVRDVLHYVLVLLLNHHL